MREGMRTKQVKVAPGPLLGEPKLSWALLDLLDTLVDIAARADTVPTDGDANPAHRSEGGQQPGLE